MQKDLDTDAYELASKNMTSNRKYFIILPAPLVFSIVVSFFLLPYISLTFADNSILSNLNSAFILLVILAPMLLLLNQLVYNKEEFIKGLLLLVVVTYGLVKGISSGYDMVVVIKAAYQTIAPLALFFLLLLTKVVVKNLSVALVFPLMLIVTIDSIYSGYQYFFVDNYTQLWFFEPLTSMGIELKQWSYEKDGVIRAPGIFTSALGNAFLLIMAFFYLITKATYRKHTYYVIAALCILLVGYFLGARIFYLGIILGCLVMLYMNIARNHKPFVLILVFPFITIIATYIFILLSIKTIDLSAAARLVQISDLSTILQEHIMGLGPGSVGINAEYSFDSAYATWLVSYGLFFGGIIIYLYYWISKELLTTYNLSTNDQEKYFILGLLLYSIVMMYISQFQFAMMTGARWYFVIAAALSINHSRLRQVKVNE